MHIRTYIYSSLTLKLSSYCKARSFFSSYKEQNGEGHVFVLFLGAPRRCEVETQSGLKPKRPTLLLSYSLEFSYFQFPETRLLTQRLYFHLEQKQYKNPSEMPLCLLCIIKWLMLHQQPHHIIKRLSEQTHCRFLKTNVLFAVFNTLY